MCGCSSGCDGLISFQSSDSLLPYWIATSISQTPVCSTISDTPSCAMHWLRPSYVFAFVIELMSLFFPTSQAASMPTCSKIYGNPARGDCTAALDLLPRDTTIRYFVEQQMRTAKPVADWILFVDPRRTKRPIAQLPKLWSSGEFDSFLFKALRSGFSGDMH